MSASLSSTESNNFLMSAIRIDTRCRYVLPISISVSVFPARYRYQNSAIRYWCLSYISITTTWYSSSIADIDTQYRYQYQYRNSGPHLQAHLDLAVDVSLIYWLLLEGNRLAHLLWYLFTMVAIHESHVNIIS